MSILTDFQEELYNIYPQEEGIITLDIKLVRKLIKRLVRSQNNKDFRNFLMGNPKGIELINGISKFIDYPLIRQLLTWLGGPTINIESGFERLKSINIELDQLLFEYFSHLYDISYLNFIEIVDKQTKKEGKINIQVSQNINFQKNVLNDIANSFQKYNDLEHFGFLYGKRNADLSISEISDYILLKRGTSKMVGFNNHELSKFISKKKDTIVGWYHSHPSSTLPIYSNFDKIANINYTYILSIFKFLRSLRIRSPIQTWYLATLSAAISQFDYPQILYLLKAIKGGFSKQSCRNELADTIYQYVLECYKKSSVNPQTKDCLVQMTYDKAIEILSNIANTFHILKEKVDFILDKHKKNLKEIHFDILPFAGLLVCPQSRFVAVIDCLSDINPARPEKYSNELYYYRINSY